MTKSSRFDVSDAQRQKHTTHDLPRPLAFAKALAKRQSSLCTAERTAHSLGLGAGTLPPHTGSFAATGPTITQDQISIGLLS